MLENLLFKSLGLKCPICGKPLKKTSSFGMDCEDNCLYNKFKESNPEYADFDFEKASSQEKIELFLKIMQKNGLSAGQKIGDNVGDKLTDVLGQLGDFLNKMKKDNEQK